MSTTARAAPAPGVTLLRVKRKRDDSPVESLLLQGEAASSKRSAVDDLRERLQSANIDAHTENVHVHTSTAAADALAANDSVAASPLRRVYKLVATVSERQDKPDAALIARLTKLHAAGQLRHRPPEVAVIDGNRALHDRHIAAQQQRAQTAREEKIAQARLSQQSQSQPQEPFHFLDVSIARAGVSATKPGFEPTYGSRRVQNLATSIRSYAAAEPDAADRARQDELFSDAMKIVKSMPDKDRMNAYASLLDDYWSTVKPSAQFESLTFTQEVERRSERESSHLTASARRTPQSAMMKRIDVMQSIAPNRPSLANTDANTASSTNTGMAIDDSVWDVYELVDESLAPALLDNASGIGGSVIVDSAVAGWFGLVIDENEENRVDSDEDEEDENRESHEANEYPDEESDADYDSDDGDDGGNGARMRMHNESKYDDDGDLSDEFERDEALYDLKRAMKAAAPFAGHGGFGDDLDSNDEGDDEDADSDADEFE